MRLIDINEIKWIEAPIKVVDSKGKENASCKPVLLATKDMLDKMPKIDAEKVVHGEWIVEEKYEDNNGRIRCSCCDLQIDVPNLKYLSPYCEHCGAKMDGE